jgi:nucleoid DNA-binding protein
LTKQEFVNEVARRAALEPRRGKAVDAFLDVDHRDAEERRGEVNFTGFGKFSTQHRAARQGVNPRNPGEKVRSRRRPCRSSRRAASSSRPSRAEAASGAAERLLGVREGRARGGPRRLRGSAPFDAGLEAMAVATTHFADRLAEAVERKRSPARRRARPAADLLPVELRGDAHDAATRARASAAGSSTRSRRTRRRQAAARVLRGARRRRHRARSSTSAPTRARPACS